MKILDGEQRQAHCSLAKAAWQMPPELLLIEWQSDKASATHTFTEVTMADSGTSRNGAAAVLSFHRKAKKKGGLRVSFICADAFRFRPHSLC